MKFRLLLLSIILLGTTLSVRAAIDPGTEKTAERKVTTEKDGSKTSNTPPLSEATPETEIENSNDQQKFIDPDSSQYTVNKFNYLFYFIYRMKYLDFEEVAEDEPTIGLQE